MNNCAKEEVTQVVGSRTLRHSYSVREALKDIQESVEPTTIFHSRKINACDVCDNTLKTNILALLTQQPA